ncbi:ANTAR domain-containing protein, partial [Lacticaseibacillus rhamnosus]
GWKEKRECHLSIVWPSRQPPAWRLSRRRAWPSRPLPGQDAAFVKRELQHILAGLDVSIDVNYTAVSNASPGDTPFVDVLRQALADRKLIERAKGLLMKKAGLDEASAFRRLQKLASDKNLKLVEIARILLTAEEAFLRVLEHNPSDHYARFALGRTLQRQSRLEEARAQLALAAAPAITKPMLVLCGEHDEIVPRAATDRWIDHLPYAQRMTRRIGLYAQGYHM